MRQLVYISTATGIDPGELDAIAQCSQRNNARIGITGLLIFNGQNYVQVLEGAADAVEHLLDTIEGDSRHSGVVVALDIEVADRAFPDWDMGVLRLSVEPTERRRQLDETLPDALDPMVRKHLLNFATLS